MRKWVFWVGIALLLLAAFRVGVHRDFTLECQNTWSTCGYREWVGVFKTRHWYKPSALESFIRRNYPGELTNRWNRWHATPPESLLGLQFYCGFRSPPMDGMIVDRYLKGISDSEKKALYDFFCNANAEAAQNRVSNIWHAVFADK